LGGGVGASIALKSPALTDPSPYPLPQGEGENPHHYRPAQQ
jgi:hypothetical protein